MRNFQWIIAAALLGLAVVGWSHGRAQQAAPPQSGAARVGQQAGAGVDSAINRIEQGAAAAEAGVQQGFAAVRAKVNNMGTEGRVYGRLRWDKALAGATLNVQAVGATITLTGTVPDQAARTKAITLAQDTVGVTKVIDQLSLATKPQ